MNQNPTMCHERTDPLQLACAVGDLSAELQSLSVGLDILRDDDSATRRQMFIINSLITKLSTIMTSCDEIVQRADEVAGQ